jgi:glycerol-3-phosphate dehydrogenase
VSSPVTKGELPDSPRTDWRTATAMLLRGSPLDVLVIGGGIVGAGIARDAAMRGLRTGLVEQHDFAFGTSSRSSRLLHGGIRYLAQGRIGLVREASVEKKVIHHIAPHLAQPLPFVFPTYGGNRNWVLWQLKIGVKIYDLLCGGHNFGRSSWLTRVDVLEKIPGLAQTDLKGAVRYYDGFTNDARLVIDTLRSAANHRAMLLNYCRFRGAAHSNFWHCEVEDMVVGTRFQIQSRAVVNATGPWADGLPHSRVKLRLTKGVHVVVDHSRLPVVDTVVMTDGKRILFAIPWGERTILGTTDTDYNGSLDVVTANENDILHVLTIANHFFPSARLTGNDVIRAWAGLRPLLADRNGDPSDISRSHEIRNPEPGWWDVAGGKLTTYRLMAEQTLAQIVRSLKLSAKPCQTATEPLLPAGEAGRFSGILPPEFTRQAVEHYVMKEWAIRLEDVMARRTCWHYYYSDAMQKAERVADWMSELLGWSGEQRTEQLRRYRRLIDSSGLNNREAGIGCLP